MNGSSKPSVLVVDDDPANLSMIGAFLEEGGYAPSYAGNGKAALDKIRASPPDVVLLDITMPGMDGYQVLAEIKKDLNLMHIPVIFLSAIAGPEAAVRGFEAGAADYVAKPFDYRELLARVAAQAELHQTRHQLEEYARQVQEMNNKLIEAMGKLEELATTDLLTALPNRRYVLDRLGYEADRARRTGKPFCLGILDADRFKRINDEYGHEAGDLVLASFGRLLRGSLRGQDLAGRWGGEEFALVLPETAVEGALVLAERLLADLRALRVALPERPDEEVSMTATIGLAEFDPGSGELKDLIRRADRALYDGKRAGRDRVVVAGGPAAPG